MGGVVWYGSEAARFEEAGRSGVERTDEAPRHANLTRLQG